MLFTAFFWWWYGEGWIKQVAAGKELLARTSDFFSISLLIRTLFSPFRQISAGRARGSLNVLLRALIDRLVSRFVGAFMRIIVMFVGIVSLIFTSLAIALWLLLWPLLPITPLLTILFGLTGK